MANKGLLALSWTITAIAVMWCAALVCSVTCSIRSASSGGEEFKRIPDQSYGNESQPGGAAKAAYSTPDIADVHHSADPNHGSDESTKQRREDSRGGWWSDAELRIAQIALGALLIAVVQAGAFAIQLWYMKEALLEARDNAKSARDAVEETRKSDERQLRAYISIGILSIDNPEPEKRISFRFYAMNHGKTPARDFGYRAKHWFMEPEDPIDRIPGPIDGDWNEKLTNIFPHGTLDEAKEIPIGCSLGNRALAVGDIQDVFHRAHRWVIGIEVKYWDVFSEKEHFTREYYSISATNGMGFTVKKVPLSCAFS